MALFATGFDIPNNIWENADISLANGINTQKATGSYTYDQRRLSYFGRIQYNYKEKAFVSALLRRDSSTKFGPHNRVGIFPSLTAGYILSQEAFLADSSLIDFFKIRGKLWFARKRQNWRLFVFITSFQGKESMFLIMN
jgi:hypothetical protein